MAAYKSWLNPFDRVMAFFSPQAGLSRMAARRVLASYDAAKPSRLRKFRNADASTNQLVGTSAAALRTQARYLERNHDIARGILRTMVNNIVGPNGIGVEFQPRLADGTIHEEYAAALADAWKDWTKRPEVTWTHTFNQAQRLICRTWLRDGEGFTQRLMGPVANLDHGTTVPYSIELMEPDLIPLDLDDSSKGVRQGIARNAWGRRTGCYVFKSDPADSVRLLQPSDLKWVPWQNMLQVAMFDRIGQLRGVSEYASIITRLEDIKDYEESERIAARISAMLTAYVKRQAPDGGGYEPNVDPATGEPVQRQIGMAPGMIIDTLAVGEEIGIIDSKRPNPNLVTFRAGQLRAAAAGIGASYSSISKNYDGTYSAQRQELVEQWVNYAVMTDEFVGMWVRPIVEDFIAVANMSGVVKTPKDVKPGTANDVLYVGQQMPWIDQLKEAEAFVALARAGFISEPEVIRKRGGNPSEVLEQTSTWRQKAKAKGLVLASDAANDQGPGVASGQSTQSTAKDGQGNE